MMRFDPGTHIDEACAKAAAACRTHTVEFEFNGIVVKAMPGDTAGDLHARWDAAREAERKVRDWARHEQHRRRRVADLMADLDSAVTDPVAAIRWLCNMEEATTIYAPLDRVRILLAFAGRGYTPNVLLREDGESLAAWEKRLGIDGQRRWLIGQALDGIAEVGAPHQVIHTFAKELTGK